MRIALVLALVLSSACVSSTATRGEKVASGVARVAFSVPFITGAASTTIGTTLYGVSALALESSAVGEFTPGGAESVIVPMILGYVGAGVLCAIGFPLLVTGTSLISTTLDEGDTGGSEPAAIRRMMRKTAREVVEEEAEPKVIKRCVEGWDCPIEEEDQ